MVIEFQTRTKRRPLRRDAAARVIAAPFPKRTSGARRAIAGLSAGGAMIAIAVLYTAVGFALCYVLVTLGVMQ